MCNISNINVIKSHENEQNNKQQKKEEEFLLHFIISPLFNLISIKYVSLVSLLSMFLYLLI